ncbi:MAG TPA: extracellular solute-binding protein [Stellaceae bacterium]|jgi:iron(III) transport system substrate-binding protein|nr:extracellular solute-binding protein [Stellaceae bacterium]
MKSPTRRRVLAAGAGLVSLSPMLMAPRRLLAAEAAVPDLAAARKEGPLLLLHGDQEPDVVKFLALFTEKTGIQAHQQRLLPGTALPKLEAELKAGRNDTDVYWCSDIGLLEEMRKKGQLQRYESPEIASYGPNFHSDPPGFWTAYVQITQPMMFSTKYVPAADGPKTWMDLLNPRWKGQIGFQNSAAGSQYTWWYLLKDILPADYWDRLLAQQPRVFASSTQIMTEIQNGNLLIGGKVSDFQYVKAKRDGSPVEIVFPPEGTPSLIQGVTIIAGTKRPNAAKVFVDFLLSKEGQTQWNTIQGSASPRPDAVVEGIPQIKTAKLITVSNLGDYQSREQHAKFVTLWNKMSGF